MDANLVLKITFGTTKLKVVIQSNLIFIKDLK